jgi:hypothetical protein
MHTANSLCNQAEQWGKIPTFRWIESTQNEHHLLAIRNS